MSDANEPDVDDDDAEKGGNVREQDRFLPIANISRIMKNYNFGGLLKGTPWDPDMALFGTSINRPKKLCQEY